jgi:hypothetical protein
VSPLDEALDRLVPAFPADAGDWSDVVARSRAGRRTRQLVLATAVIGVAALLATPAFGLRGFVADLLGRVDIPFAGKAAPTEVKAEFYDLGLGAPRAFAPGALAAQTRKVATISVNGTSHVLWVAPTSRGGYCWQFSGWFGGCRPVRTLPHEPVRGRVRQGLLGVSFGERIVNGVESVSRIGGDVLARAGRRLELRYADGSSMDIRFYFVSAPINAGFYLAAVPAGHATVATRPVSLDLYDDGGHLLARQTFRYETAAQRAKERARQRAEMERIKKAHGGQYVPDAAPTTGTPEPVRQRGSADGVTVVVGGNGLVAFDLSGATAAARDLIGTRGISYGCVKRLPFHPEPTSLGTYYAATTGRAVIRLGGNFAPPFLACEIQGGYGHTWPDRNQSHSAVEIALTPAGQRFFDDRAAARDLVAFYRSKPYRNFRQLGGAAFVHALQASRYAGKLERMPSATAPLPANRIGFVLRPDGATLVERSESGRRFHITVKDGRARDQNVRGLAGILF